MFIRWPRGRFGLVVGVGDVVDSATKHHEFQKIFQVSQYIKAKHVNEMLFSPSNCGSPSPLMYLRGRGGWMW